MKIEVLQQWIESLRKGVEKIENCECIDAVGDLRALADEMEQTEEAQRHAASAVPGIKLTATELLAFLTPAQHEVLISSARVFVNDYLNRGGDLNDLPLMTVKTYAQIQDMWDEGK